MARKTLDWRGPAVTAKLRQAQIVGINGTMGACVVHAKSSHAWKNRTGVLEGGIDIVDYAAPEGTGVRGVWGVRDVRYALIHELGGVIKARRAKALAFELPDGSLRFAGSVTIPARPYLRPAADVHYPGLAGRIRTVYEREEGQGNG